MWISQLGMSVDDGTVVTFGGGQAFDCCNTVSISNDGNFALDAHWYSGSSAPGKTVPTQHLIKVYYYPIMIFYVNMQNPMSMKFNVTTPNVNVICNFDNVYSFKNTDTSCPAERPTITTTNTWTGTNTQTTTNTVSSFSTDTIQIDVPILTVITTQTWTGVGSTTIIHTAPSGELIFLPQLSLPLRPRLFLKIQL